MVQEQPSRIGRRLSAIVAADVAGYSRLMGLDEAGTARILREHRVIADAVVAKHGCACRKSNPNILVVRPAQDRAAKNGPGQFAGARDRRILLQR
jgi:class 3 adenylate cyclase